MPFKKLIEVVKHLNGAIVQAFVHFNGGLYAFHLFWMDGDFLCHQGIDSKKERFVPASTRETLDSLDIDTIEALIENKSYNKVTWWISDVVFQEAV